MPRNSRPPPIRTPGDDSDEERRSPDGISTGNQPASSSDRGVGSRPNSSQEKQQYSRTPNMPGTLDEPAPSAPPSHGATPSVGRSAPPSHGATPSGGAPTPQGDANTAQQDEVMMGQTSTEERRRPPPLTFDSPQDRARAFFEPYKAWAIRISKLPGQAQDAVEAYARKQKDARIRASVEWQLKRLAVEAGDAAEPDSRPKPGEVNSIRFNPAQIVQAYKASKPQKQRSLLEEALDGRISWGRFSATIFRRIVLVAFLLLLLHLLLALLVFGVSKDITVDSSGALIDPASRGNVATASTVELQSLWDYPKLSFGELRRIEDVVFIFNAATHVLQISIIEKTAAGEIHIKAGNGDVVRIEPSGHSYWQRVGHPEVFLSEMEAWRTFGLENNPEVAWLTSGLLATQVSIPASTVW